MENQLLSTENFNVQITKENVLRYLSFGFYEVTPFLNTNDKTTLLKMDYSFFEKENDNPN